jgi:hypothetical protein
MPEDDKNSYGSARVKALTQSIPWKSPPSEHKVRESLLQCFTYF